MTLADTDFSSLQKFKYIYPGTEVIGGHFGTLRMTSVVYTMSYPSDTRKAPAPALLHYFVQGACLKKKGTFV